MAIAAYCKRSLTFWSIILWVILLSACGTVVEQNPASVDTEKPTNYAEYKAWRDRYDPDAKEYAEFKAWEAQYRRWQWEQQQQADR